MTGVRQERRTWSFVRKSGSVDENPEVMEISDKNRNIALSFIG